MQRLFFCLLVYIFCFEDGSSTCAFNNRSFPEKFLLGVGISAYQVEGGWNADGKGENIWDYALHMQPNLTSDGQNADVACDFYHKYKEDVLILKDLGVDTLRLSISWSRILPKGTIDVINWPGIFYYRSLLTELLSHGIEPLVTLFHWDLPRPLQERGGLLNEAFEYWFADYTNLIFEQLGDLVKYWFTFNESISICTFGYGMGRLAPFYHEDGVYDYICAYNLLKAHARAYHIYDDDYRYDQEGLVSIVLLSNWHAPGSSNPEDIEAARRISEFVLGLYANPIYFYDWPEIVKSRVAYRSFLEGRSSSRLPVFTSSEIQYIHGTADFFSLNHYSSFLVFDQEEAPASAGPGFYIDVGVNMTQDPSWPGTCSEDIKVVPSGMRNLLALIKQNYKNPPILITENGCCDLGGLDDKVHVNYIKVYLSALLDAIEDESVNVIGYTTWSYMDSFEWGSGYETRFGIYQVDFNDPNLPRTPKSSAIAYKQIIDTRCLCDQCVSPSSY